MEIEELEIACTIMQEENAYIIRGFLENEGIPCQLENLVFHALPTGDLTKVRLWTKKSDADKARKMIQEHEEFNVCSACGHVVMAQDTACDFCGESLEPA